MTSIEEQIKEKEEELAKLKAVLEQERLLTPDQKLAIVLHRTFCRHNHTDGCGWYYEIKGDIHDWSGHDHGSYLKKAVHLKHQCFENGIDVEVALKVVEIVKDSLGTY